MLIPIEDTNQLKLFKKSQFLKDIRGSFFFLYLTFFVTCVSLLCETPEFERINFNTVSLYTCYNTSER